MLVMPHHFLAAVPDASGTGVDIDGEDIRRARDNATARGLDGRAAFVEGPAQEHLASASGRADLILNIGAYHALIRPVCSRITGTRWRAGRPPWRPGLTRAIRS